MDVDLREPGFYKESAESNWAPFLDAFDEDHFGVRSGTTSRPGIDTHNDEIPFRKIEQAKKKPSSKAGGTLPLIWMHERI